MSLKQLVLTLSPLLLLTTPAAADSWSSLGCFKSSDVSSLTSKGSYTYQSSGYCEEQCSGKRIAALINGNQCYCGDTDPTNKASSSNCDSKCYGYGSENCGGSGYYTVYVNADVDNSENNESSSSSTSSSSTSSKSSSSSSTSTQSPSTSTVVQTTTASPTENNETTESETETPTTTESSAAPETTTSVQSSVEATTIISTVMNSQSSGKQSVIYRTVIETPSLASTSSTSSSSSSATTTTTPQSSSGIALASSTSSSSGSAADASATPTSTSHKKGTSGGVIAGAVVGSVAGVAAIAFLIFGFLWYRKRKHNDYDSDDDAFTLSGPEKSAGFSQPQPPPSSSDPQGPNPFLLAGGYAFDTSQQEDPALSRNGSQQQSLNHHHNDFVSINNNNNINNNTSPRGQNGISAINATPRSNIPEHRYSSSGGTSGNSYPHEDYAGAAYYDTNSGQYSYPNRAGSNAGSSNGIITGNGNGNSHAYGSLLTNGGAGTGAGTADGLGLGALPQPEIGRRKLSNGSLPDMIAREPGSLKVVNN